MQVTVGSDWQTSTNGRRNYAVSLDLDDLIEMIGAERVEAMSRGQILDMLNKRAEIAVVAYVADQGGMSQEMADRRIAELKHG